MPIAFPFLFLFFLAGLILPITGVRGYRIGDHPVCGRCGFDLFGMPGGLSICSECGSDVSQLSAIRVGHRKRKPGSIVLGIVLLFRVALLATLVGWQTSQDIDWEAHLPTFWLIHQAASTDVLTRDSALAEILRRMQVGNLSDGETQKLVVRGLAFQADTSKTWVVAWGEIIESAHAAGKLTTEQWRQYALNAADPQFAARPRLRRGDNTLPLRISDGHARVSNSFTFFVQTSGGDDGSDLASPQQRDLFNGSTGLTSGGGGSSGTDLNLDPALVAKAPLGRKFARIKLREQIFPANQNLEAVGAPIAERTLVLQAPWELVAADAPTVQPINDEKYRAAVAQNLKVDRCEILNSGASTMCQVDIKCTGSPVPLAYNVFIRAGGRDLPAGSVYFPASPNGDFSYSTGQSCPYPVANQVDVILKPSASVCASTIDMTSYWNGEITIPNVPVIHR
jgi:hypothetical protein